MKFPEPSVASEMWRLVRSIIGYILVLSFIGTMMGDKASGGLGYRVARSALQVST